MNKTRSLECDHQYASCESHKQVQANLNTIRDGQRVMHVATRCSSLGSCRSMDTGRTQLGGAGCRCHGRLEGGRATKITGTGPITLARLLLVVGIEGVSQLVTCIARGVDSIDSRAAIGIDAIARGGGQATDSVE